ncbi:MAG: hypothetical protein ABIV21_01130 [Pyrinomonadaceae bacterium]
MSMLDTRSIMWLATIAMMTLTLACSGGVKPATNSVMVKETPAASLHYANDGNYNGRGKITRSTLHSARSN